MTVLRSNTLHLGLSLALAMTDGEVARAQEGSAAAAEVVAQQDRAARTAELPVPRAEAVQEEPAVRTVGLRVPRAEAVQEDPSVRTHEVPTPVVVVREDPVPTHEVPTAPVEVVPETAAAAKSKAHAGKAAAATRDDKPPIQTLGEGDQKIFVVDHGRSWSMHFENVITGNVVLYWKQAGGPDVTMKVPVDRVFTMSVHDLAPELIIERLFEGYGYTMHYDDAGRLESVRVYSPRESLAFKTPRLTESLSDWKKAETEPGAPGPERP